MRISGLREASRVSAYKLHSRSRPRTKRAPCQLRPSESSRLFISVFLAAASLATSSCAVSGTPQAGSSGVYESSAQPSGEVAGIRQTDDQGRNLPFVNRFPNRWSINNDATNYEPCTYVAESTVIRFGLDPGSVEDAASSDFQTARGCRWYYVDDALSSLSQSVGNLVRPDQGLRGHKDRIRNTFDLLPDLEVGGRQVLQGSRLPGSCSVFVRSGDAVVGTTVNRFDIVRPPTAEVCNTAVEFLRATIADIPL